MINVEIQSSRCSRRWGPVGLLMGEMREWVFICSRWRSRLCVLKMKFEAQSATEAVKKFNLFYLHYLFYFGELYQHHHYYHSFTNPNPNTKNLKMHIVTFHAPPQCCRDYIPFSQLLQLHYLCWEVLNFCNEAYRILRLF